MNRILSKKQEICSQIMALDIEQLEELTDMIEIGAIPGMTTPKVALTCRRCEKLYGDCSGNREECIRRYRAYMVFEKSHTRSIT